MTEQITSFVATPPENRNRAGRSRHDTARRHLRQCCTIALKGLSRALPKMLDQVDDALFLLAEKADHDNTQKLYFDAMREVRIKRPGIEKNFRDYLAEGFENSSRVGETFRPVQDNANSAGPILTLVENDALEETLAVTHMANRITGLCKEDLFALNLRIGWLLDDTALEDHDNPLSPQSICEAFERACSEIDAVTEIRLIVLKLFDKHMVSVVEDIYREVNGYLVRKDILPCIRAEVKKQPPSPNGQTTGHTDPAAGATVTQGTPVAAGAQAFAGFATGVPLPAGSATSSQPVASPPLAGTAGPPGAALPLQLSQELLATLQQIMRVNGPLTAAEPGFGQAPPAPELLGRLTALQGTSVPGPERAAGAGSFEAGVGHGGILRDLRQSDLGPELNHSDDLMIDVVAMMFDYIFDDQNIPTAMKALIGRLQIPLLKVALLDKSFFSRRFHPARKLLNSLAEAAVGWSEEREEDDSLYHAMVLTVQRVLDEFADRVEIIADILAEFEDFLNAESKQAEENAWWSAKVIQGRERLASARALVETLVDERLTGIDYGFLCVFVREHWQNLLLTAYVKDGEDSAHWRDAVAVLDDLVWSITPMDPDQDRARLTGLLPDLLARLKQGMARISMPGDAAGLLLAKLARIHLAQVRGQSLPAEEELDALQNESLPPVSQSPAAAAEISTDNDIEVDPIAAQQPSPDQQCLRNALESASRRIYDEAQNRPECSGMGTTMVAAWFHDGQLICAHAGDSRIYRLREGQLVQITLDHSLRQQLVSNGFYTMEEAQQAIASNLVTRALGVDPEVEIEVRSHAVRADDIYLLCSDGLSDLVADEAIAEVLKAADMELESAAGTLIRLANEAGGNDNISVSLVRLWQGAELQCRPADLLELVARTDVGRRRAHNEDAQGDVIEAGLVLLADGMGGYNAGEVASQMAIDCVIERISEGALQELPAATTQADHSNPGINYTALNALFDNAGVLGPDESSPLPELELGEVSIWPLPGDVAEDSEEIVLETGVSDSSPGDISAEHTAQVAALEIGAWVEFRNRGDTSIRARLTWISESTGNYLFTDRHGHKVVDATPAGLALEFHRASAVLIEDVPLFERAVNHLMSRLRPEAGS